jgi:hypothetical protein
MKRYGLLAVSILTAAFCTVGYSSTATDGKNKKDGPRDIGIVNPVCMANNTNDSFAGLPTGTFTAKGMSTNGQAVTGRIWDPTALQWIQGTTDSFFNGAETGGAWVIVFPALNVQNGYLLEVTAGDINQRCTFNIVAQIECVEARMRTRLRLFDRIRCRR